MSLVQFMSDALLTTAASTTTGSVCCNARIPPYIKQVRLAALILSDSRKTARAIYVNQQFSQRALPAGELTIASSVSAACGLSLSLSLALCVCLCACLPEHKHASRCRLIFLPSIQHKLLFRKQPINILSCLHANILTT